MADIATTNADMVAISVVIGLHFEVASLFRVHRSQCQSLRPLNSDRLLNTWSLNPAHAVHIVQDCNAVKLFVPLMDNLKVLLLWRCYLNSDW